MIAHLLAVATLARWLLVADPHVDPFAAPTVVYGQDSSYALFDAAVDAMHRAVPDPPVVVIGGDFLAHHFQARARAAGADPERAAVATIARIAQRLDRTFPHAQFLIALGNNDDPCGDYHAESRGRYMRELERIFAPLVDRNGASPGFDRDFTRGGYYTARLPGGAQAVVLNSVYWSFVYRGPCQTRAANPGAAELAWLRTVLPGRRSVILMHIPPGFDAQSTTMTHRVLAVPFLSAAADADLRAIFERHRDAIGFAIGAHTHRLDFRVPGGIPMFLPSSISPIYRNNPAFFALSVDGNRLQDVVPYVYEPDDGTWSAEPSLDRVYGIGGWTAEQLAAASARIADDDAARARWIDAYDVWSRRLADVGIHRWQVYRCTQIAFGAAYAGCAGTTQRTLAAEAAGVAAVIVAALALVAIIRLRRRPS